MSVGGEFGRRVSDDELCAEVRQAVEDGDEDALRRLGFGGFAEYAQRLSEIMSDSVTDGLDPSADDFGAIMGEVASPARYAHHLVNEAGTAIQSAKDAPLGIHMKPIETDFDDDALKSTVGNAASMDTPEKTVEALAEGLGYAVKKSGNEFIEKNAEQRSRAGFEVKVKRSGSAKCCPWCAARIGSWAIANAPDGVFGCHANCSCTVEYTSSTGAKTSASGANLHRYGAGAFVEVEYEPPHVMTHEEAKEKGGFDEPKRLTKEHGSGIIISEEVRDLEQAKKRDHKVYITDIAINNVDKVKPSDFSDEQANKMQLMHKKLLTVSKNENDSNEVLMITDLDFSSEVTIKGGEFKVSPASNPFAVSVIAHAKRQSLVYLHNHPSTNTFSIGDIDTFCCESAIKTISVVTNQGEVYILNKTGKYSFDATRELLTTIKDSFSDEEIDDKEFVKKYLKECQKGGVEYVRAK